MASILVYAGVKGYKKYQMKRANFSTESQTKARKNQKSISSLVIPSIASAHIIPGGEDLTGDGQPPRYELDEKKASFETPYYTASYSPENIEAPTRNAPPPPVMLGLTLCESPITPTSDFDGDSGIDFRIPMRSGQRDHHSSQVFELPSDEASEEPISPAPLHVVKRSLSPLPLLSEEPDMMYSSDESGEFEERSRRIEKYKFLEVPRSPEAPLEFEAPPIPPKSPARRLKVVSD